MNNTRKRTIALLTLAGAFISPAVVAAPNGPAPKVLSAPISAADQYLADVYSNDGVKVGDISDYALQFKEPPQLRYVIIATGGFLGMGSDLRAVPADAVSYAKGRFSVSMDKHDFDMLATLPADPHDYLSDPANTRELARIWKTPVGHATLRKDFVLFSALTGDDMILDSNGVELGRLADLWVDFNTNEAPYIEMTPTGVALMQFGNYTRFELPTTRLASITPYHVQFNIPESEVASSKMISNATTYVAQAGDELATLRRSNLN